MTAPGFGLVRRLLFGSLTLALAGAALLGAGTGSSAAALTEPAGASAAGAECVPENTRIRPGSPASEPNDVTAEESATAQRQVAARLRSKRVTARSLSFLPTAVVDVHVNVIRRANGTGSVSVRQVNRQINVLNQAFAGRTSAPSAPTLFRFRLATLRYVDNEDWHDWSYDDNDTDDDREAKTALHQGGRDDLNIYVAGLEDELLGYATFPFGSSLTRDGVVLLNRTLPGGSLAPYNLGDTATHEVGHWLGLYHTFERSCTAPGDEVEDTPYQREGSNVYSCLETLNTCSQPGRDPVHNYMSYGNDTCLNRFSPGQAQRMGLLWAAYRAPAGVLP